MVGNHAQFIAFARQPQNGLEEIMTELAIDPRRTQDDMTRQDLAHRRFAGGFGASVNAKRCDRIAFHIG